MDKHPWLVKIICLSLMAFFFCAGIYFFYQMQRIGGMGGVGDGMYGGACFILCGIFGSMLISPWIGRKSIEVLYWPEPLGEPPPEYPRIRAKMAEGRVDEALAELGRMLDADTGNYYLADLATDALMDNLGDYDRAVLVLERFFVKDGRDPADAKLVMKLSDAYLETGRESDAVALLEREIPRFKGKERQPLENRLAALKGETDLTDTRDET